MRVREEVQEVLPEPGAIVHPRGSARRPYLSSFISACPADQKIAAPSSARWPMFASTMDFLLAHAFVYAAKAHPEISTGGTNLAVTYATNSLDFSTLV